MPRVVVIDNDSDFLSFIQEALADAAWQAVTTSDGAAALTMVQRERPDAVLLDVRLSGKTNGWEICSALRTHLATRHIPVIVCSGDSLGMRERRVWLRENGVLSLEKPFDLDDLYMVMGAALAQRDRALRSFRQASSA